MFKKLLTSACLCFIALWAGTATAREITFDLLSDKGPATHKSWPGKHLLLAFGYTTCPEICPTTLYEFAEAMKELKNPSAIQPIFVTIDPVSDDAKKLQEYVNFFDEHIVGLAGEMKNIRALVDQLGATFGYRLNGKRVDNPIKGSGYTVYHSALIYLFNPQSELIDTFDYQIGAHDLAVALNKVLGEGGNTGAATASAPAASAAAASEKTPEPEKAIENEKASNAEKSAATAATAPDDSACPLPRGFTAAEPLRLGDVMDNAPTDKVVLLNVWALWCAPCRTELPLLDKLAAEQKEKKQLLVQTLNLGDKEEKVSDLFEKMGLKNLPQTRTEDNTLLRRVGAPGLPLTALFVNGQRVATKGGQIDDTSAISAYAECMARQ